MYLLLGPPLPHAQGGSFQLLAVTVAKQETHRVMCTTYRREVPCRMLTLVEIEWKLEISVSICISK